MKRRLIASSVRFLLFVFLLLFPVLFGFVGSPLDVVAFFWHFFLVGSPGSLVNAVGGQGYLSDFAGIITLAFWVIVGTTFSILASGLRLLHFALLTYPVVVLIFVIFGVVSGDTFPT